MFQALRNVQVNRHEPNKNTSGISFIDLGDKGEITYFENGVAKWVQEVSSGMVNSLDYRELL